jgi:hypothetical protein
VLVPALCVAAFVAVGVSTWLVLDLRLRGGGVAALVAGVLLVTAGLLLPRDGARRERMLLSFADRAFDGAILGSLAWATRLPDPATAAGALLALAAGFLAAYIRARGAALGYLVEEGAGTRAIRCGLIAIALIAGWTAWAVYVVAIWMLLVAALRASQVAKEERA